MSEQAKIIAEMQEIIMRIVNTGTATEAEADRIDELTELMLKQKCYKETDHPGYEYQGEEIASLFFKGNRTDAIRKMCELEINPDDFFGFAMYHFDEDEGDSIKIFTESFIADVNKEYLLMHKDSPLS